MNWTTPNIEKLSENGIIIENYYGEPSCGPARSSLMTGRYAYRTGMQTSVEHENDGMTELPLNETTLAQEMKSANYKTYIIGKWDLGYSSVARTPNSRGYDYFYGYFAPSIDYYNKTTTFSVDGSRRKDLQNNGTLEDDDDCYLTDDDHHSAYIFQNKAEAILQTHVSTYGSSTPLFLYYALQLVHYPSSAPERFLARCASQSLDNDDLYGSSNETKTIDSYCARVLMLDEVIGNLTCSLENNGLMNNTILIIAGDNGGYGMNDGTSYPYRGNKWDYSEGGIRTNAIMYSPLFDDSLRGTTYNGTFHVTDWLPTLMGLATSGEWSGSYSGADLDGVDQMAAIEGSGSEPRSGFITFLLHNASEYSIVAGHLKVTTESISSLNVSEAIRTFDEDLDPDSSYTQSCSIDSSSITIEPSYDYEAILFGAASNADVGISGSTEEFFVPLLSSPYLYFILFFAMLMSLSVISVMKLRVDRVMKREQILSDDKQISAHFPSYNSIEENEISV